MRVGLWRRVQRSKWKSKRWCWSNESLDYWRGGVETKSKETLPRFGDEDVIFPNQLRSGFRLKTNEPLTTLPVTQQSWNTWKRSANLEKQATDEAKCWGVQGGAGPGHKRKSWPLKAMWTFSSWEKGRRREPKWTFFKGRRHKMREIGWLHLVSGIGSGQRGWQG